VEQKIDGLVAKLVSPPVLRPVHDSATPPTAGPPQFEPSSVGGAPWSETWKRQGTIGPGSWLPIPASLEQVNTQPDTSPEQPTTQLNAETPEEPNYETEADRQFHEKIRSMHNFGDGDDLNNAPQSLFAPSKLREPPIEHALVQQLLSTREADTLLEGYREMSASFPFVIVPPGITAQELHRDRPMLLLAMITAASSHDHMRQMSFDTIFRRELAERTIITPRRTLGLVQSVLVYLSWYVVRVVVHVRKLILTGITTSSVTRHNRSSFCIISSSA
jgi:hypothetical protein